MWGNQAVKGILLDVDGTLVLSNDAHANAWAEAFEACGYPINFTDVRSLIGMGGTQIIIKLLGESNVNESVIDKITETRKKIFKQKYMEDIKPAPGARILVKKLRHVGFKLVAASSAEPDILEAMLKKADVEDLILHTTSAHEVDEPKPDPEIIKVALRKLGLPVHQAALIGDSPFDVEAARRANIMAIMLRCGGYKDHELHGATAIYDNPDDLATHLETSPIAH
jgi:HAD superfamily hydrolase (TIGR01509 family)